MFLFFLINTCQSVAWLISSSYLFEMPKLELMHLVCTEISSVEKEDLEAKEKGRQKNDSFLIISVMMLEICKKKKQNTTNVSSILAVGRCCHLIHGLLSKSYKLLHQHP